MRAQATAAAPNDLLATIMAVDLSTATPPNLGPIGDDETVVGVVSESLKKFYLYTENRMDSIYVEIEKILNKGRQLNDEHRPTCGNDPAACSEYTKKLLTMQRQAGNLKQEAEALIDAFWNCASAELRVDRRSLRMREGYQVVQVAKKDSTMELGSLGIALREIVMELKKGEGARSPLGRYSEPVGRA